MTEVLECYTERNRKKADFTILLSFCTQFATVHLTAAIFAIESKTYGGY